jgi:hypothetical protein
MYLPARCASELVPGLRNATSSHPPSRVQVSLWPEASVNQLSLPPLYLLTKVSMGEPDLLAMRIETPIVYRITVNPMAPWSTRWVLDTIRTIRDCKMDQCSVKACYTMSKAVLR